MPAHVAVMQAPFTETIVPHDGCPDKSMATLLCVALCCVALLRFIQIWSTSSLTMESVCLQAAAPRKEKGTEKRERADKEVLTNMLFKLFEEKVGTCSTPG